MSALNSRLFQGWIRHRRYLPKKHSFRYPLFMSWLDLDELDRVMALSPFWSLERLNLVSFYRNDYLGNSGQDLADAVKKRIKRVMWERVGILRDRESLKRALKEFDQIAGGNLSTSSRNFVTLAQLVATAALWREESRGGHFRNDFPEQHEEWRVHSIQKHAAGISSAESINF